MEYNDTSIYNIIDFLNWISDVHSVTNIRNNGEKTVSQRLKIYYRGQAQKEWLLTPGIYRKDNYNEYELLRKSTCRIWSEVSKYNSYLDKLIFLQHYGLVTRLLDVTFNPLVALYFACCEVKDKEGNNIDGAVYCGYQYEKENNYVAELTCEFVFKTPLKWIDTNVLLFIKDKNVSIEQFAEPLFILPVLNNPRIEQQNGAFIMAPLLKNVEKQMLSNAWKDIGESSFFEKRRAIVHCSNKVEILKKLSELGIDAGTIYQDVTKKLKTIVLEEEWKIDREEQIAFE